MTHDAACSLVQAVGSETSWWADKNWLLIFIGLSALALEIWMIIEAIKAWPKAKGVLEENALDQIDTGDLSAESKA